MGSGACSAAGGELKRLEKTLDQEVRVRPAVGKSKRLKGPAVAFGAAAGAAMVATALRLALSPWLGHALPFSTYFVATLFVVWYFGFSAALFNIVLSSLAGWYFFVSSETVSALYSGAGSLGGVTVLGYVVASAAASFLLDLQRKTTERLRREADLRETAERDLRVLNSALARSNEDLRSFAYAASHDLQEPLRMITAYTQLLSKNYSEQFDSRARTFFENIVDGTERMRELIADLLAYTEIGAEPGEPPGPVDLNEIVAQVKANLMASITETSAMVSTEHLPVVEGHATHIVSLFQNLISNSIKYKGEQPPRVHISAQCSNGDWRLAVRDNGIGIDPEYHDQIFEVFKRLHGGAIPGTGVGLAICKRVVERHGGQIWVDSSAGAGATFFFSLPSVAASGCSPGPERKELHSADRPTTRYSN